MKKRQKYVPAMDLNDIRNKYDLELLTDDYIMGVYFLVHNGEVIYVGQSKDIRGSLPGHRDKSFDDVLYIRYSKDELDENENFFIKSLKPLLNKKGK